MNVPTDIAAKVIEGLRGGGPFLMALMTVNILALIGFALVLNSISNSMERREAWVKYCLENRK